MIGPSSTPGRGGRLRRAPLWRVHPDIRGQGATIVEGGSGGAIVAVTARGHPVVLVPGGVLPGALAYGDLVSALGDRVDGVVKELEVYAGEEPPPGFSLDIEVEAIARAAEARNFDRFHLLGYSAGGACALAFVAAHGERLLSLALMEPAWAGHHRTAPEEALARRLAKLRGLPPDEFMRAFVTLQVAPGVQPPPRPD